MITMNELIDLRMQQHIAQEIYRQQIMQRVPDPFPSILPIPMPHHVFMPPRLNLPGVEITLQNDELWKQFHQIGTEMIITKSGRRMFPSMRLSINGLEEDDNYCVLLEMMLIGDCRYKFSGSQWITAGGAEPQSPQRIYLHPDSPALGSHWQAQPISFNKVKLTNNTLDNCGHTVLASMHKYQPRIHVIRTNDLNQIPWSPQQDFLFPETEFIAVTAYQNDRITKLKIDNNPFAKGFRETGQSRCKRKMSFSPTNDTENDNINQTQCCEMSPIKSIKSMTIVNDKTMKSYNDDTIIIVDDETTTTTSSSTSSSSISSASSLSSSASSLSSSASSAHMKLVHSLDTSSVFCNNEMNRLKRILTPSECKIINNCGKEQQQQQQQQQKQQHLTINGNDYHSTFSSYSSKNNSDRNKKIATSDAFMQHFEQNMQTFLRPSLVDLACTYFSPSQTQHHGTANFYTTTGQSENLLPINHIPTSTTQPLPAILSLPSLSSAFLIPTVSDELFCPTPITDTLNSRHSSKQQHHGTNQIIHDKLFNGDSDICNRVTNNDDLSSAVIQLDTTLTTNTTNTATSVQEITSGTGTGEITTISTNLLMANDKLITSTLSINENNITKKINNSGNSGYNHLNSNSSLNEVKKKGFSISAILGSGT